MKKIYTYIFFAIFSLYGLISCSDNSGSADLTPQSEESVSFIVCSDLHYFSPELGVGETSFYYDKMSETKLAAESQSIIEAYFRHIITAPEEILIITGDMTYNGETINHQHIIDLLQNAEKAGKRVFVLPGNHDINNPLACKYSGSDIIEVASPTAAEFEELYNNYGYSEAYSRDKNSLSYAAKLTSKYDLIALDACRYVGNISSDERSGGHIANETLSWLREILDSINSSNRKAIVALHHGLIEHFSGQMLNPVTANYLLDNAVELSNLLAEYDVNVVLTGHFHANDIVKSPSSTLYDIETGSALVYPHSLRTITLSDSGFKVRTSNITDINYDCSPLDFAEYSKKRTLSGLENYFNHIWKNAGTDFPDTLQAKLRTEFAKAVFAHYYGDETMSAETANFINTLLNSNNTKLSLIGLAMQGIYNDILPADRNIEITF